MRVLYPLPQAWATVDQIEGEPVVFVLVGKLTPERKLRVQRVTCLEQGRDQPPGAKRLMPVTGEIDVQLDAVAQFADVLVKGRLEPAFPQGASPKPLRGEIRDPLQ